MHKVHSNILLALEIVIAKFDIKLDEVGRLYNAILHKFLAF
jgi:hypothetical protein